MRQKHPLEFLDFSSLTAALRASRHVATACVMLAGALLAHPAAQAQSVQDAAPTRTTLVASAVDTGIRTGETFTARVATSTGTPVTTGTVDFVLASGQSLGSAIVAADGTASLTVAQLPAATTKSVSGGGQLAVTANYNAATTALANSASVATAVATPAATTQLPDFTVTASQSTLTVTAGAYGTSVLTVTSVGGYTGSMELSCSNLPAQVTCAFNPTQQTLTANGTFVSTVEITTQAPSGTASSAIERHSALAMAMLFPGSLVLLGLAGRRRKGYKGLQMLGVAMLLGGVGLGLSGCSQRYDYLKHAPSVATGTLPGTYPINVAVDGNVGSSVSEHDLTISLVVQ
ncbi:hypothetical protein [Acidipila sp. EB88]|uniref:hypothetical protein n=1 Tax=Acidipila sp. EB88 TaxID=2305226 RepID=UPI000F5DF6CB|nr:hypothetical protein [Acidipila sp. EB88]RRA48320.1 hypothetical protein D1Y84_08495 [Acidipila sp. EB88]